MITTPNPIPSGMLAARPLPSERPLFGKERRDHLRGRIDQAKLAKIGRDEIQAHFSLMPEHYWETVTEEDLVWGLETIHGFLHLIAAPQVQPTQPFLSWRQTQNSAVTRMLLCTWDRQGLLAKAAACFSAVKLDIFEADVFTRSDNIVLDVFSVANADGRGAVSQSQLREMTFLLEGALSEPPRFASIWACSRHKYLAPSTGLRPEITIDNGRSSVSTAVQVKAANRLGLLYDILDAVATIGFNVQQARIATTQGRAQDTIYVTDAEGHKIQDTGRLEELRRRIEVALT